jgi:hypothetical protein
MAQYEKAGFERKGGKVPPFHTNCRCTVIIEMKDGKLAMVILVAIDERTCPDCEALDGKEV